MMKTYWLDGGGWIEAPDGDEELDRRIEVMNRISPELCDILDKLADDYRCDSLESFVRSLADGSFGIYPT